MKKILFITPPYHSGIPELAGRWVPLNFVYLAGAAREAGLEAVIYDAMAKDHGYPEIERQLLTSRPDYVASSAITATVNDALKTLELAKRLDPACVTILGGIHPTFMYEETFRSCAAVDYIVMGEGEPALRQLLAALEKGEDPAAVAGIAFRDGERIVATAKGCLTENLDELPAAWDLLEWPDYEYFIIPDSRFGAISTSRGCDRECLFCSQQRLWGKTWRARDPQKVADELEHLHSTYQANVFLITDEYPARDPERWERFLDILIGKELPIYLIMEARVPDIIRDREIMWKYRKAGVVHMSVGIESVEQAKLDLVRKGTVADQAREALEIVHRHGIVSEVSFLVGFPDETPESIRNTLRVAQDYNPDNANFYPLTPWPYSDMYEDLKPYIREWDYSKYNFIESIIEPEQMTRNQLDVAIVDCFRKFYMGKMFDVMTEKDLFKRNYLLRATKLIMGSSFIMKKLAVVIGKKVPAKIDELKRK